MFKNLQRFQCSLLILSGFTVLTAGVFQPVMYFWNVVLSYVRKNNVESRTREISNDIELGEGLAPNTKHTIIHNQKEIIHSQKSEIVKKKKPMADGKQQRTTQTSQSRRAHGTDTTHYYQTPTDQRNYHML